MAFSQEIPLAPHTHVPINAPDVAWHFPYGAAGFHIPFNGTCNETLSRIYRRGYAAAVSYSDYNVGVLLDKLDALGLTASTLVTVIGDHGWHLGDKDTYVRTSCTCLADSSTMFTLILDLLVHCAITCRWAKMTAWEDGVRIPMIIRCPWKTSAVGKVTSVLAEVWNLPYSQPSF
jgi:arylsulfatase A-like enzyme